MTTTTFGSTITTDTTTGNSTVPAAPRVVVAAVPAANRKKNGEVEEAATLPSTHGCEPRGWESEGEDETVVVNDHSVSELL
mmetsp:Transcript_17069/g.46815  ORF Transcript_17069/g.46815 Transcript_17069/m.46815 type:complete len:81 (+) Transcript_17069:116-358(+)